LISDQRDFGEHVFLNIEDIGLDLKLDKRGKLIILKKGREEMNLGTIYPSLRTQFLYPPFWMYELP
jgi:hypothetical protein